MIKIFVDTNIFKFAIEAILMFVPRKDGVLRFGNKEMIRKTYKIGYVSAYGKIDKNSRLFKEVELLSRIADLARNNTFILCRQFETEFEFLGLKGTFGKSKYIFEGIKIENLKAPIEYSRILGGLLFDHRKLQMEFLKSIEDKRFKELQKITGAYQGNNKYCHQQMLDAFHLWCAEYNRCDYFLTCDFKLIRHIQHQSADIATKIVSPSDLLKKFSNN